MQNGGINKLPNTNSFKCLCRNPLSVSRNEKLSFHPYFEFTLSSKYNHYFAACSLDLDKVYSGAAAGFDKNYTGSIGLSLDRFALILQSTRSFHPKLESTISLLHPSIGH